jgi:hypothetical protein
LSISKIFFPTLSLLHPTEVIFRWFFALFQYSTQNRPFLRRINFQLVNFTLLILYGANHLCRVSSQQKRLFFGLWEKIRTCLEKIRTSLFCANFYTLTYPRKNAIFGQNSLFFSPL